MEYLTIEDLKKTFHIGNTKAYKLCETRGFPSFRIGEGQWLIDPKGLDEWVQKLQKTATKTHNFTMTIGHKATDGDYTVEELREIMQLLEADENA